MSTFTIMTGTKGVEGAIKTDVNHSLVASAIMLTQAQAWIYQRLRVRKMKTVATGTMTASQGVITLPTRYKQGIDFKITPTGATLAASNLKRKDLEWVEDRWTYDGTGVRTNGRPRFWATSETDIVFEQLTDQAYEYRFRHFQSLPALSTDTETNFLTEDHPGLLHAANMFRSFAFLRNIPQRDYWHQVALAEINDANVADDLEREGEEMVMEVG